MKIAVLSGKGGTGKTLVSVNLAAVVKQSIYIDCDVEEPNGHLFFKPKDLSEEKVSVKIPHVENELCNGCRKCVDFCRFNALTYIQDHLIVLEEICHSCGGCTLLCPEKAFTQKDKIIGKIQKGISQGVCVNTGILNTGIASGVPIINKLLLENKKKKEKLTVIDCPPGSGCSVMESIKDVDYCVLVAEPTLFGVHNLNMVYDLVKIFNKSFGVILNKCIDGENPSKEFSIKNNITILGEIPFEHELGKLNSNGEIAVRVNKKYHELFLQILASIKEEVHNEAIVNP